MEIKCQLDATDDFYCRSYCLLNIFRAHYGHHQELESIIQVVAACRIWCLVFKLSVWCGAEGCVSGLRAAALEKENEEEEEEKRKEKKKKKKKKKKQKHMENHACTQLRQAQSVCHRQTDSQLPTAEQTSLVCQTAAINSPVL